MTATERPRLRLPRGYRSVSELEIKRSRFITTLARADSEAEARAVIADARAAHPAARHHCSAFVVEEDGIAVERSSDDREPAGTAGMPMLEQLRGAGVSQVVAVVTRYFGGVLLGTGGLARAYGDSVALALADAPRVRPSLRHLYELRVSHADAGRLLSILVAKGAEVLKASYGAEVVVDLAADPEVDMFALVASASGGRVAVVPRGRVESETPT